MTPPDDSLRVQPGVAAAYTLVTALGGASLVWPKLAVFSVLLSVIALASLSRKTDKGVWTVLLTTGLSLSVLGLGRFIFKEALPGIAEARGRDSERRAVSLLREIYFAQNAMRRYGMIDPDGDGTGSAGRLSELTGHSPSRGNIRLSSPPLAPRLIPLTETRWGPATNYEGYLFLACIPAADGAYTAQPQAPVDEEAAEKSWLAYAWPAANGLPHSALYVIDAHEGIFVSDNRRGNELRFVGATHAPPCDTLVSPPSGVTFTAWQGKKPRADLPSADAQGPSKHP